MLHGTTTTRSSGSSSISASALRSSNGTLQLLQTRTRPSSSICTTQAFGSM
jgi:hypothetical protein